MAVFTPFNHDGDIGREDVIIVCSDAPDRTLAAREIGRWADKYGYAHGGEYNLNVRRNLSGRHYFYAACYRGATIGETDTGGRDKNLAPSSSASLMRKHTAERGMALYENYIRSSVESSNAGKYVAINVKIDEPLDYEIGDDQTVVAERILARRPDAILYTLQIGHPAVVAMRNRRS